MLRFFHDYTIIFDISSVSKLPFSKNQTKEHNISQPTSYPSQQEEALSTCIHTLITNTLLKINAFAFTPLLQESRQIFLHTFH